MRQNELIERFVASFGKLNEMAEFPKIHPLVQQLAVGSPDSYGRQRWRPMKIHSEASQLEPLRAKFPARLPPLFEQLVLSYRWAEVDLQLTDPLANGLYVTKGSPLHFIDSEADYPFRCRILQPSQPFRIRKFSILSSINSDRILHSLPQL